MNDGHVTSTVGYVKEGRYQGDFPTSAMGAVNRVEGTCVIGFRFIFLYTFSSNKPGRVRRRRRIILETKDVLFIIISCAPIYL